MGERSDHELGVDIADAIQGIHDVTQEVRTSIDELTESQSKLTFRDEAAIRLMPLAVELNGPTPMAAILAYQLADSLDVARSLPYPLEKITEPIINRFKSELGDRIRSRGPIVDPGAGIVLP